MPSRPPDYLLALSTVTSAGWAFIAGTLAVAYLVGSIPWSYLLVKWVTGEDLTTHGTGNVGAMNVRRTTGSWGWFVAAMILDATKGLLPVLAVYLATSMTAQAQLPSPAPRFAAQAALLGAVLGHNYSLWLSVAKRRILGGKGLATGGGALLAYEPTYFLVVLAVGLGVIALTRYMMAGQVAAAISLPLFAIATGARDWPFALLAGILIYIRHHKRFLGLLKGEEPRLYVHDRMGPRG